MNKLVKLGIVSLSALVLVACGDSSTVDKENMPVDLGEVEGYDEDEESTGFESAEVIESEEESTEEDVEVMEESEMTEEEKAEIADAEEEYIGLLDLGESHTLQDITFTVTDSKYVGEDVMPTFDGGEVDVTVLEVSYKVANNTEGVYRQNLDVTVYADGALADTYPDRNDTGEVNSGSTMDGKFYFGIVGEPKDVQFNWVPTMNFSDTEDTWADGNWDVLPK